MYKSNRRAVLKELTQREVQGLTAVGEFLDSAIKGNAPTGQTGQLAGSYHYKVIPKEKTVYNGSNLFYAPYVEWGTGIHAEHPTIQGRQTPWSYYSEELGRWVTTRGNPAQPHLRPAYEDNKKNVQKILQSYLGKSAKVGGYGI
jgi:HK97 gp10 family phage protein